LLEARLLANPAAAWLERNEIDAIRREQELAGLMDATAGPGRVALGRLLKADVLVLLCSRKPEEGAGAKLVVAETHGGLRILSQDVPVSSAPDALADLLEDLVARSVEKAALKIDEVYAVPPFYSRDLSFQHDYLKDAYAELLEQRLSARAGALVVELAEANAIAEEYRTADPAGVVRRPLPLYVLGEYRHEGRGADRRTAVKLCVKRGEQTVTNREKTMLPSEVAEFLWDTVLGAIRAESQVAPRTDIAVEAQQLADRATAFFKVGDWAEALALAEASLLLRPQQPAVLELAADAAARLGRGSSFGTLPAAVAALGYQRRALEHFRTLRGCQPDADALYTACGRQLPVCTLGHHWIRSSTWPREIEDPYRALVADWRELLLEMAHEYARAGAWRRSSLRVKYVPAGRDATQDYADKLPILLACQDKAAAGDLMNSFLGRTANSFEGRTFLAQIKTSHLASPELRRLADDRLQEYEGRHRPRNSEIPPQPPPPPPSSPGTAAPSESSAGNAPRQPTEVSAGPQERVVLSPVSIRWTDDNGNRGTLISIAGCLPLDHGTDLLWGGHSVRDVNVGGPRTTSRRDPTALYVLKEKGIAKRVWTPGAASDGRRRNDLAVAGARILGVDFDGRYVWMTVGFVGEATEVWVVDPQDGKCRQITVAHGLPLYEAGVWAPVLAAGVAPGEAIVAGWFGRTWLAKVEFAPDGKHQVQVFHEAREVTDGRGPAKETDPHMVFLPQKILVMSNHDSSEKRVLVFRHNGMLALVVDPKTLNVEVSKDIRVFREEDGFFQGAWYYRGHLKSDFARSGLLCRRWPDREPTLLVDGRTPGGKLLVYEGDLYAVSDSAWYRARLNDSESARFELLPHVAREDLTNPDTEFSTERCTPWRSNCYGLLLSWVATRLDGLGLADVRFETEVIEAPPGVRSQAGVTESGGPSGSPARTPATAEQPPRFVRPSRDLLPIETCRDPMARVREAVGLAVSRDGSQFATVGSPRNEDSHFPGQREVVLWSTRELKPLRSVLPLTIDLRDIEFSPDGTQLMCASPTGAMFWDLETGKLSATCYFQSRRMERVFLCPNGRQLVSMGMLGGVEPAKQWDVAAGTPIAVETLESIAGFLPDGTLVGGARTVPGKIVAWNFDDVSYRTLCDPCGAEPLALSPHGDRLVTDGRAAFFDGSCQEFRHVRLWDLRTAREIPIVDRMAVEPFYSRPLNDKLALCVSIQWDKRRARFTPRYELKSRQEQARQPRYWAANNLASSCRAAMIACRDGQVTLRKTDGRDVTLLVEHLTEMDRRFVNEFADALEESAPAD
jgi:tetratricopeptide (TPR) repeat protein